MPRVNLQDPFGMMYTISTRQTETILKAWFDEVLPYTHVQGRPGVDDFEVLWPRIYLYPMWAWGARPEDSDPDWFCDSRVLGRLHEFPARNGEEGLKALLDIRRELEAELATLRRGDAP